VKDRHSTSDDDLLSDDGLPVSTIPPEYWLHFLDDLTEEDYRGSGPHLITVDELRAAGALDVPPAWRKSLGVERDLFSLFGDDDPRPENQQPEPRDLDRDASADELR
jgi:hypothetical protein